MKNNWQTRKLGEVCDFCNGQAHEKCIDENGKYIVINSKFISSNGENYKRTNNRLSPLFIGDIAMVMSDVPKGKTLAKCFLVDKDNVYTLNQRICVIRTTNFKKKFLYYQLNRNNYLLDFDNEENQTNLRKNDILNCPLLTPPLPEQQRIVKVLDEVFEDITKAKANAEKNLTNARELFESYLQKTFETTDEHRLTQINSKWEEKKIGDIGITQTGTTPSTSKKEYYGDFIPFIKPADIDIFGDGTIRYNNEGLSEEGVNVGRIMKEGSVLMVCIGATIGKVGFVDRDVSCNQQINSLTVKNNLEPKFFYYAMRTKNFYYQVIKNSSQATLPIINKSKWEDLLVYYPKSLTEQRAIVAKLDALADQTKKLEAIYQQKLADLEELKKSVLQKAFNGELK